MKDLHNLGYRERLSYLNQLKESEHIKIPKRILCSSEAQLRATIEKYSTEEGSEGAMLKLSNFKYELDRKTLENMKYKTELSLDARVLKVNRVSGAGKVFNYHCGLSGPKGDHFCGKTFNTKLEAKVGGIIKVAFVDISGYTTKEGKKWARWWSPHVIMLREDKKTPDSIETAWRMVKQTTGRFQDKEEPKFVKTFSRGKVIFNPEREVDALAYVLTEPKKCLWMKKGTHTPVFIPTRIVPRVSGWLMEDIRILRKNKPQHIGDYEIRWDGKRITISRLQEHSAKKRYVIQEHWRGSSVHADVRFEMNDHLIGFTLADGEEDIFKDLVGKHWKLEKKQGRRILYWDDEIFYELDKAGKILKQPSAALKNKVYAFYKKLGDVKEGWKIDWSTGEEKTRPAPKGGEGQREKIWAGFKARQPKAWLKAEGVTPPRAIEPVPGGTQVYPGVFVKIDSGTFEAGAQKPYFKEFFLGGKIKGRIIFRLVAGLKETKKKLNWLYWKPDDQLPYVLGSRAVKEHWFPDSGSALPSEWEQRIPKEFKFWLKKGRERIKARAEAINYLIDKGFIKERRKIKIEGKDFRKGRFIVTKRYWKGAEVVRKKVVEDFHIKVDQHQFHLADNPLWKNTMAATLFKGESGFFIPGKKSPGTAYNPNKKIPAFVETLDQGSCRIIEETQDTIRVAFQGKNLKGNWIFMRTTPQETIWTLKKSEEVRAMSISFKSRKFRSLKEIKSSTDLSFPYQFNGVAFAEGTWHKTFYAWEVIARRAQHLVGARVVLDHKDTDVLDTIGEVVSVTPNPKKKFLEFDAVLYDTEKGKDAAILIENEKIDSVSVRLIENTEYNSEGKEVAKDILEWKHVAIVVDPEVTSAKIKAS